MSNVADFLASNHEKRKRYSSRFQRTFGRQLSGFFDLLTGFDVIKFDDEIAQPPDGVSTREVVQERWGDEGVNIILGLIGRAKGDGNVCANTRS